MDSLSIKKSNGKTFIYFDTDYGKKLDNYSRDGFSHFKNRTGGVRAEEFFDFLIQIFDGIKITNTLIRNEFFDFSNEFNSFINSFNSINFNINSLIAGNDINNIIEVFFNKCIDNFDGDSLVKLIDLIFKFNDFQVKVFKANGLILFKDDLMKNLKDVCSLEVYNYYNTTYNSYLNESTIDFKKVERLFLEIQSIILDDWKKNIDSVDDYKFGSPFKYICQSKNSNGYSPYDSSSFVQASLLTERHAYTCNQTYGFVFDPNDIAMAYSEDLFIKNDSSDVDIIYNSGVLPIVQSFKTVNENTSNGNKIILNEFNPIGIFCVTDGSKELNPYYQKALELKKEHPDLPILDFDITLFTDDYMDTITRDSLVDYIGSLKHIYTGSGARFYDYFSYFWDDFMNLKKSSNYSSRDIINLFFKYYYLLNSDLDIILDSNYDDDFVLKLIRANSRYNYINKIINDDFDYDDIKDFYLLYSDLEETSFKRLGRLFPKSIKLLNLLDEFFCSNNYNTDCFKFLKDLKTYDDLISYLDEFYSEYSDSINKKK